MISKTFNLQPSYWIIVERTEVSRHGLIQIASSNQRRRQINVAIDEIALKTAKLQNRKKPLKAKK